MEKEGEEEVSRVICDEPDIASKGNKKKKPKGRSEDKGDYLLLLALATLSSPFAHSANALSSLPISYFAALSASSSSCGSLERPSGRAEKVEVAFFLGRGRGIGLY